MFMFIKWGVNLKSLQISPIAGHFWNITLAINEGTLESDYEFQYCK